MPPGGSISPFDLRQLNQQRINSQGQKVKILLVAVVSGATHFHTLNLRHEYWLQKKKQHYILIINLEHIQPHGGDCHDPTRYYHLSDTVTESSKGCSSILSSQLILGDGEHGTAGTFNE